MANLNIKIFDDIVSDTVKAIQASANALIDFSVGSILRAIAESNSTLVVWLQSLLLDLLIKIRAATCVGSDLDSWCADFNFYRLLAVAAGGNVTFARFTPTNSAFIPVGTLIQTTDITPEQFAVITDTTNSHYSATLGGYTIPAGIASIAVPVLAVIAGAVGNAQAGTISLLTGSLPGVDTVANPNAFTNGSDAETDDSMRARFIIYIGSLAKGTKAAIANAIASVQQGISYSLTENYDYSGAAKNGYFYAVVDDGSGAPSSGFLDAIYAAIEAVRGFTITFGVFAPTIVTANVTMTIDSTNKVADQIAVKAAINAYEQGLGVGQPLPFTKLAQIAYDTATTITNVRLVQLNGGTADLSATAKQRIMAGTTVIS